MSSVTRLLAFCPSKTARVCATSSGVAELLVFLSENDDTAVAKSTALVAKSVAFAAVFSSFIKVEVTASTVSSFAIVPASVAVFSPEIIPSIWLEIFVNCVIA